MSFFKNSNHHQHYPQQQPQNQSRPTTSNYRSNKKSDKTKRSIFKSESKIALTDLATDKHSSTSKSNNFIPSICNSKSLATTKVKSCSWKRSEKQISGLNTLTNKKSKSLRKKLPPSSVNTRTSEETSVCRPGTLYSDVLFAAGSSCLVKINSTPRRSNNINNNNNAQKKLTKTLIKYSRNVNEASDKSKLENKINLFPCLQKFNDNPPSSPSITATVSTRTTPSLETSFNAESLTTQTTTASSSPSKCESFEEADVVILAEHNDQSSVKNEVSYGNYLEQHFQQLNVNTENSTTQDNSTTDSSTPYGSARKLFCIDIPKWNFMDVDISSDAFPKFLCQFDDENYLRAEKMALLCLKLALGNNSAHNKFKF